MGFRCLGELDSRRSAAVAPQTDVCFFVVLLDLMMFARLVSPLNGFIYKFVIHYS